MGMEFHDLNIDDIPNAYYLSNYEDDDACYIFDHRSNAILSYAIPPVVEEEIPKLEFIGPVPTSMRMILSDEANTLSQDDSYLPCNTIAVVPNEIHGFPVTKIASKAFYYNKESYMIKTSATYMENGIADVQALRKIVIPNTVTTIESPITKNQYLKTIVNQTGKSFDWNKIITGTSGTSFVTGTVGNVTITDTE